MGPRSLLLGLVLMTPPAASGWFAPSFHRFRLGSATMKAVRQRLPGVVVVMEGAAPGEKSLQVSRTKTSFGEASVQLDFDRRGRLQSVIIWPFEPLSREGLEEIAAPLESRRYELASCPEDEAEGLLVERAGGQFEYLLSPSNGLYALMRGDTVDRIELALGPPDSGTCP